MKKMSKVCLIFDLVVLSAVILSSLYTLLSFFFNSLYNEALYEIMNTIRTRTLDLCLLLTFITFFYRRTCKS